MLICYKDAPDMITKYVDSFYPKGVSMQEYCSMHKYSLPSFRKYLKLLKGGTTDYVVYMSPENARKAFIEPHYDPVVDTNPTHLESIINGHLLGDGSLILCSKDSINYALTFTYKYEEYLLWVKDSLHSLAGNRKVQHRKRFDKRTEKIYESFQWLTRSSEYLTGYRKLWYPNGTKIIPKSLKITPETLLRWYMDDGSYINRPSDARKGAILLATLCFSLEDAEWLVNQLNYMYDLKSFVMMQKGKPCIQIPALGIDNFFNTIGPCPVSCYSYKWPN